MTDTNHEPARLRAAAIQLNSSDDVAANLAQCEVLVRRAAERGAQLVVLPECFSFLGSEVDKARHAEPLGDALGPAGAALGPAGAALGPAGAALGPAGAALGPAGAALGPAGAALGPAGAALGPAGAALGPAGAALAAWSRELGITVIGGGMPERSAEPARPYNTSVVFGPDGHLQARYRKVHLFDVDLADGTRLRESAGTLAGGDVVSVAVGGARVGLSICYDLRFPELYRGLVDQGCSVLTVPAAFTLHTGRDHWHVLLRARAIESQCWVVAAAQWGVHQRGGKPSHRASFGHSLIVDPWGTVVADCSDGVGLVIADLERAPLERVRRTLPSLAHRRLG